MTVSKIECFKLACDRCEGAYVDDDSEATIHMPTSEKIRDWAGKEGWVISASEDVCVDCRIVAASEPHEFRPRPDQFCVWCGEWADRQLHTNAPTPGQLEIRAGDQAS